MPTEPPRTFAMIALTAFYHPSTYLQTARKILLALLLVGGRLVNEREGLDYLPVEHSELGYLLTHCYLC